MPENSKLKYINTVQQYTVLMHTIMSYYRWTVLPMPDDVIKRVKAMGSINLDDTCGHKDDLDSIHDSINSAEELLRTKMRLKQARIT
jgi:hypothetical protein